ncbi:MAG: acyl carrier protein [Alphaproteobacteria bacterium]|nr:acyl carrier protein [Alphaproteobacteria bacterium]
MTSTPTRPKLRTTAIKAWLAGHLHDVLGIPTEQITADATFETFGLDSVDGVVMASELETAFGIEVDPALFLRNPTLEAVFQELQDEGIADIEHDG